MSLWTPQFRPVGKPWISMNATQFTLGDTDEGAWTGSSWDFSGVDNNIRTALTLVSAAQDFDFRATGSAFGTTNGPMWGFYDNGTSNDAGTPTNTDAILYARNASGAADIGWIHGASDPDGAAKSAGWMSGKTIQISRRGSTYYGLIDGVLDRTITELTGNTAGGFFIGCTGGSHDWQANNVQYRLGPGLPNIT
jgi:hypothetical protein